METASASDDGSIIGSIVHSPPVVADPIELMDTSESYSNPEVTLNTAGNGSNQLPVDTTIEAFTAGPSRQQQDERLALPSCSKNSMSVIDDFSGTREDNGQDFYNKPEKHLAVNAELKRLIVKNDIPRSEIPKSGTPVCPKMMKKAGPYILGPLIGSSPVQSIIQCLARKEGTDRFYTIKILTLKDSMQYETQDDRQGKMLLHSEYSLLSLLQNQDGVVHHHGFFKVRMATNNVLCVNLLYMDCCCCCCRTVL